MRKSDLRVVLVTVPPRKARTLASTLVAKRLAACANLVPRVRSFYWWEGKVEEAAETLLVLKTTAGRMHHLISMVKELHPYTVPEVVALPVHESLEAYADWVREETEGE